MEGVITGFTELYSVKQDFYRVLPGFEGGGLEFWVIVCQPVGGGVGAGGRGAL